ncbi:ecysteroid UDP-glucosyltransferase [Maruca vitrata nucleopolyhedrovirus]|uniref:Ecdysteroid UDP-glucosyltransferase n=1 Tax=Maruca vitrata nucleopolyhedrovirus TaxID=1307954 RepID=A1YR69_9ABAC|nr:ecysteroid UDP-glucosyltransferase [Maruca vitrata nucleopolyhedrovirus]ABL75959.1 ecysteroid UDP-glucosyltransferase [Maruca vitrata nucleopolyhedrovirus]
MIVLHCWLVLLCTFNTVNTANILAVFPMPAYSHHIVYRVYIEALAEQCHNVTVIKPKLFAYSNKTYCGNITEIDADMSVEYYKKLVSNSAMFRKRGVVSDTNTVTAANYVHLIEMFKDQFDNIKVRNFITNNQTFDLVVVEAFADYALVFGHLYDPAPVIQIAPGYGLAENFDTIGAVARHPIHHPNIWRDNFDATEENTMTEIRLYKEFKILTNLSNSLLKQQFGPNTPTIEELRNKVQLLLLNLHPIFDNNRPVPPSVQYLGGGIHLTNNALITSTISTRINKSKRKIVYVSFGSSIDTKSFANEFLDMLIDTFKRLKNLTILWKIDDEVVKNVTLPANVITQSWFNQRAVLNHGKTAVFITQGGLQSSDEALEARVPMVCLPMMGDQFYHAHQLQKLGVARALDTVTVSSDQLLMALNDVLFNAPVYKKRINELNAVINHDKLIFPPLDKAIKFTERVIRYRNDISRQLYSLKTTAANVPYSNYYMYKYMVSIVINHLTH